jgi:glutamine amidotransferase
MGNVGSVVNLLRRVGATAEAVDRPTHLARADRLILPGVGHFGAAMQRLRRDGWTRALTDAVMGHRVPILGICLGMQLFTNGSEEGGDEGFGWIRASTVRFAASELGGLPIPHIGWSATTARDREWFDGLHDDARFYYVHSYHVECTDDATVAATCNYGRRFTAAVRSANVFGSQFHPEKSHRFGMRLLENFIRLTSRSDRSVPDNADTFAKASTGCA